MTRWMWIVPLPLLALLAAGCPYDSKTSLGDPDPARFDKQLIGTWSETATEDGTPTEFAVMQFNNAEYYVESREADGKPDRFRAYLIDVGGHPMLQVNEITAKPAAPDSYAFARYSFDPDGALIIRFIGEQIVPKEAAADAKALREFMIAHWDDRALDDPDTDMTLRRQAPQTPRSVPSGAR